MTVEEDLLRAVEGGDHVEREKLRHTVILKRCLLFLDTLSKAKEDLKQVSSSIQEFIIEVEKMLEYMEGSVLSKITLLRLSPKAHAVSMESIVREHVRKHRPIDIQTTDGGPGVGTSEKLVCLRMVESFIINDLDLQSRFHYARYDSKTHPVERVMSSLTNALGDGRFIDVPTSSILDDFTENQVMMMSKDDFQKAQQQKQVSIATECAKKVADRYEGTRCMETFVHAHVPGDDYSYFYFDEIYMMEVQGCKIKIVQV